jgi:signal transduction histidine kinase
MLRTEDPAARAALFKALDLDLSLLLEAGASTPPGSPASLAAIADGLATRLRSLLHAARLQLALAGRLLRRPEPDLHGAIDAMAGATGEIRAIAALIRDFLDFAHPEPLRLATADLHASAESVVRLAHDDAAMLGVALVLEPGAPVRRRYDEERIKQALHRLVRNAVEAARPGGSVRVRVRCDGDTARVEVEDDGDGVTGPSPAIFAPFFTTHPGRTGLGLAIVERTIAAHGGTVEVDSRPGRTRFAIALPREEAT